MELCRIVLVDDNSIFCFIFEKLIEKYKRSNIEIMKFDNGQSALDHFVSLEQEKLPDIVFVDINMPIMNGWQLLDSLIATNSPLTKKTPFFIVSSSDDSLDINKSKEYPFVKEYLNKPLGKVKLFDILDQYLN